LHPENRKLSSAWSGNRRSRNFKSAAAGSCWIFRPARLQPNGQESSGQKARSPAIDTGGLKEALHL
jgi:hypothetical protein